MEVSRAEVNIFLPEKLPYSQICGTKVGTTYKKRRPRLHFRFLFLTSGGFIYVRKCCRNFGAAVGEFNSHPAESAF